MRHTHVGPGIWQKTLKHVKYEKYKLQDLDCGQKTEKTWKMINAHCRNWNIGRKLSKKENEKLTFSDLENCQKQKKTSKNEKYALLNLEYFEKTEK